MKAKTLEQMQKAELIEVCRARLTRLEELEKQLGDSRKETFAAKEELRLAQQELNRERAEHIQHFRAFQDVMEIAKNLSNNLGGC